MQTELPPLIAPPNLLKHYFNRINVVIKINVVIDSNRNSAHFCSYLKVNWRRLSRHRKDVIHRVKFIAHLQSQIAFHF